MKSSSRAASASCAQTIVQENQCREQRGVGRTCSVLSVFFLLIAEDSQLGSLCPLYLM